MDITDVDCIQSGIVLLFLVLCMVQDLHRMMVSVWLIVFFAFFGILFRVYHDGFSILIFSGSIVGLVLIFCSIFRKKFLGLGDGLIFLTTGIYMDFFKNAQLLFYACLFSAVVGGIMILMKKWTNQTRIAFVPFMVLGYWAIEL